jgi:hypothetical protein
MKHIIEIIIILITLLNIILIYCSLIISGRIERRDNERNRKVHKKR